MRPSTARLAHTGVRLAEISFPSSHVHVHRTRLVFIHLDNLLHFAKIDRDGRIDGFVAAYLPDELVVLLVRSGEVVSAVSLGETGRRVLPIAAAQRRVREEPERGELAFCEAPLEQLTWMYASCAAPASPTELDPRDPGRVLAALRDQEFGGVLELIVGGRVNYVRFERGEFVRGHFHPPADGDGVGQLVAGLLAPPPGGAASQISAAIFPPYKEIPAQASPALLQIYRDLFWAIADAAERAVPEVAHKRAHRLCGSLSKIHAPLAAIGAPRESPPLEIVGTSQELTFALSDWTLQLLEELEVIAPGVAPTILREATREHRFVLQKTEFYSRLPWTVSW